jgi:hypothetical protein
VSLAAVVIPNGVVSAAIVVDRASVAAVVNASPAVVPGSVAAVEIGGLDPAMELIDELEETVVGTESHEEAAGL